MKSRFKPYWLDPSRHHLDEQASKHFSFRQLVECGETFALKRPAETPPPQHPETWAMLSGVARNLLDPLVEHYGAIELTYGLSPEWLVKAIEARKRKEGLRAPIFPEADQHGACERNSRDGGPLCSRGGAAVDFRVPSVSSAAVVVWMLERVPCLPIDRLYYYGPDRAVHVSWHEHPKYSLVEMVEYAATGRRVPRRLTKAKLLERIARDDAASKGIS